MKKLIFLFAIIILLTSCTQTYTVPDNARNTPAYCQIDNTVYMDWAGNLRRISNSTPEGMSLCFDPLCTHSKEEFCAEINNVCSVVTDGERLYLKTHSYGTATITALNTDGSGRETLCEFSMCNGLVTNISTDGKYVYFVEGLYKDPTDTEGDSYGVPRRISCKGGDAEAFLDIETSAYAEIYADADNYYITDNGLFSVIDSRDGSRMDAPMPTSDTYGVILSDGNVYLYGTEENHDYKINTQFYFARNGLWKWNGAEFDVVISDIDQLAWDDGGVWYTPMLPEEEFVLVGSKESYDGKGQSLYDFIRTWTGELVYHDLATGEKTVYRTESENLKIEPYGMANGYIIAAVNDYSKLSFTYEYVNLKPEADGTVSVHGAIKASEEITQ
ncbi:MAG: hypothetical protein ACI3XP_00545 [Eubacteriales bacterium]